MNRARPELVGVTVVIPTLNRGDYLVNSLRDLLAQDHEPLEILVIDQSANFPPDLAKLVAEHGDRISYHRVKLRGLPPARNFGWRKAKYEALVYVDDDVRCGPTFVAAHLRTLMEPLVGAVAGGIDENVRCVPGELRRTRGVRRLTASPVGAYCDHDAYDVDAFKGCNFSIWRRALIDVGGFDERLNVGAALYEDLELCLRLRRHGYRIRFDGAARLRHLAAPTGGCRVPRPRDYVQAMAHNRTVLVARHLRWYERPTAILRLGLLIAAYARANADLGVVAAGVRGALDGAANGRLAPTCAPL